MDKKSLIELCTYAKFHGIQYDYDINNKSELVVSLPKDISFKIDDEMYEYKNSLSMIDNLRNYSIKLYKKIIFTIILNLSAVKYPKEDIFNKADELYGTRISDTTFKIVYRDEIWNKEDGINAIKTVN